MYSAISYIESKGVNTIETVNSNTPCTNSTTRYPLPTHGNSLMSVIWISFLPFIFLLSPLLAGYTASTRVSKQVIPQQSTYNSGGWQALTDSPQPVAASKRLQTLQA